MGKNKQIKFVAIQTHPNVLEAGKEWYDKIKGNWHEQFFKNQNDIALEIACGRGEYSVGLGKVYTNQNFVGIDLKGNRIWKGSKQAIEQNLQNVGFLRTHLLDLEKFFAPNEVSDIWVIFPDPRPRGRDERRRLTSPRFLKIYQKIAKPDAWFRLKTDNVDLFDYTLGILQKFGVKDLVYTRNLYESELYAEHHQIKTRYEELFVAKGCNIHYLKCKFLPQPKDVSEGLI